MKRLAAVAMMSLLPLIPASNAYADHEYPRCDSRNGGCSEREESYENSGCKYVCPSFERSPVHDAFNFAPFICMPGATCYEDGNNRQQDEPQR